MKRISAIIILGLLTGCETNDLYTPPPKGTSESSKNTHKTPATYDDAVRVLEGYKEKTLNEAATVIYSFSDSFNKNSFRYNLSYPVDNQINVVDMSSANNGEQNFKTAEAAKLLAVFFAKLKDKKDHKVYSITYFVHGCFQPNYFICGWTDVKYEDYTEDKNTQYLEKMLDKLFTPYYFASLKTYGQFSLNLRLSYFEQFNDELKANPLMY